MSTKQVQKGDVIQFANSSGSAIAANAPVVIGALVGVALVDIPDGESGSVAIAEVYKLPKTSAAVITQGSKVVFDVSASETQAQGFSTATGDVVSFGVAFAAAGAGVTEVPVLLTPGTGTVA